MNGGDGDYHTPLILLSTYGSGRIYIVAIPDNYADIYRIPRGAADVLKRIVSTDVYASGRDFSLFAYDDGSMILYRYVKGDVRPAHIKLYTGNEADKLVDMVTGEEFEAFTAGVWEGFEYQEYKVADVILEPGIFRKLKWVKG